MVYQPPSEAGNPEGYHWYQGHFPGAEQAF